MYLRDEQRFLSAISDVLQIPKQKVAVEVSNGYVNKLTMTLFGLRNPDDAVHERPIVSYSFY